MNSNTDQHEHPARDGVNWYAYVGNNPLRWIDPIGLEGNPPGNIGWHPLHGYYPIVNTYRIPESTPESRDSNGDQFFTQSQIEMKTGFEENRALCAVTAMANAYVKEFDVSLEDIIEAVNDAKAEPVPDTSESEDPTYVVGENGNVNHWDALSRIISDKAGTTDYLKFGDKYSGENLKDYKKHDVGIAEFPSDETGTHNVTVWTEGGGVDPLNGQDVDSLDLNDANKVRGFDWVNKAKEEREKEEREEREREERERDRNERDRN